MLKYIEKSKDEDIFKVLHPIVGQWFKQKFGSFCDSQRYAILPIHQRKNILVSAPTGSGKTLCAFSSILSYLITLAEKNQLENKVYAVYVSPLRALSRDIEVNLKQPLEEMEKLAEKQFGIRIAVRTGDTPTSEKTVMLKKTPHILITTPESLAIVLSTKRFVEKLKAVEFVIVDEIHALAENKRGVHLSLSLELLNELSIIEPVRIGLSATIAPLEDVAKFLVGFSDEKERDCLIADVQFIKQFELKVLSPVHDFINTTAKALQTSLYGLIDQLIQKHHTTLIFTNTRSGTERVINHLKEMFPLQYAKDVPIIGAHHGSLSRGFRFQTEKLLREGKLKAVVSSTSLELGIDIGWIDLVLLLGSPKSIARCLQRVGRSGHKLKAKAKGYLIVLDQDDLIECSVMAKEALSRHLDKINIPSNCLDVLAQQICCFAICKQWSFDELYRVIRQSYCFHNLKKEHLLDVISYLSGEYVGLEDKQIYAKIWYDKITKELGKRSKLARMIYMTNVGTIPEESYVNVIIAQPPSRKEERVGMIDEAFLERLKKGDVFVLGGNKYEFLYAKGMNAYVNASVYKPPTIPSWFSEMLPLSFDLALAIQRFRKLLAELLEKKNKKEIVLWIQNYLSLDRNSAKAIYNYFAEQHNFAKIPHENRLLLEHYTDEKGKKYCIFHSLYGRCVNDALSRAIAWLAGQALGRDIEIGINDNGFFLASTKPVQAKKALEWLVQHPERLREVLEEAIWQTEVFKRRFRHCATRSLMILRSYKGKSKSVGKQQLKAGFLLGAVKKISENFPVLQETKREILEDLMDVKAAQQVLEWIKEEKTKIEEIHTELPSPFSLNLIIQGYADLMRIENKIEFLKRMHRAIMEKIKGK